jgi:diguanylate cyclase (GGDEF)-like protein
MPLQLPTVGADNRAMAQSWLCPTELDQARVTEASPRIRRARKIAAGLCGVVLVMSGPWIGWWTLALFAVAVVNLGTLEWRFARSDHPERVAAQSLCLITALFAAGVLLSGGAESPLLPWLVIPVGMAATRFRAPVVWSYAGLTAMVAIAVTAGSDPSGVAGDPVPLMVTLSLLGGIAVITSALTSAELTHRDAAVLDPLTGLLNRKTLASRVLELEHQAALTGDWVCFVACDLDHFKAVNDTHGHERGDAVLRDVAYELRKALRSFELIYRLGGEEFLILLPGADAATGGEVAERLRRTLASSRPGGLELTMSMGLSAAAGAEVRHQSLFRAADEALFEAKRGGRSRIVVAGQEDARAEREDIGAEAGGKRGPGGGLEPDPAEVSAAIPLV